MNKKILISVLGLLFAASGVYLYRTSQKDHTKTDEREKTSSAKDSKQIYHISSLTVAPLSFEKAFTLFDSAAVFRGILSGEYDTTIRESKTYEIKEKKLSLPDIDHQTPVSYIRSVRDYLYRLIPVAHQKGQISDSLDRENLDTIIRRLARLEYAGNCGEHAIITKRFLQDSVNCIVFTLKKDSNQLIDHVIDLVYYKANGKVYGVTLDALMGIIGPVKPNGDHYSMDELKSGELSLDYPANLKTKRYTIDTMRVFSNVNSKMATEYYANNGFIYYEGYDDMYILAPKELLYDKMLRKEFDKRYAKVLAEILHKHMPTEVKAYK